MTSVLETNRAGDQRERAPADHRRVLRLGGAGARLRRTGVGQAGRCGFSDPSPGRSHQCPPLGPGERTWKKAAAERYAAFLDLAPTLIAREARRLDGSPRQRALDAYGKARELAAVAPRLSLDPAATVFQIGGILASVPAP